MTMIVYSLDFMIKKIPVVSEKYLVGKAEEG